MIIKNTYGNVWEALQVLGISRNVIMLLTKMIHDDLKSFNNANADCIFEKFGLLYIRHDGFIELSKSV